MTPASKRRILIAFSAAAALYPLTSPAATPMAEATAVVASPSIGTNPPGFTSSVVSVPQILSLAACLRIAMENNHGRAASRFAVTMAEAQHRQALAGYWPQLTRLSHLEGIFRLRAGNFPLLSTPALGKSVKTG